jgi:hypothetical protein
LMARLEPPAAPASAANLPSVPGGSQTAPADAPGLPRPAGRAPIAAN